MSGHGFCVALLDFVFLALSVYLGYAIRLTLFIPYVNLIDCARVMLVFPSTAAAVFFVGRQYRTLWAQAGLEDYVRFARLYVLAALLFVVISSVWRFALLPRTSLVIMMFAGVILCGWLRVSWRLVHSQPLSVRQQCGTLIVGAGDAGTQLARDLLRAPEELLLRGFVDDDPRKKGKNIAGLTVLGDLSELPSLVREYKITVALVAIPSANGRKIRALYETLAPLGVSVRVLPSLRELAGGHISVSRLRHIRLEDLLGREPVQIDIQKVSAYLRGRSVLVTGAGGSIGSEIVHQVLLNAPREVVLLGHGEQSLYLLLEALNRQPSDVPLHSVVADVADETAMRDIFKKWRPHVIFHAAAHKHVPLMEENPREALRVNALGSWTLFELAGLCGAERFVMISSDKAVRPSSVMGATKRIAERLISCAWRAHPNTRYMTVRFGNVLGSRGSVVPLFERQIRGGGPVTVTHRDMTRYFMLIPEAVSLVLQAGFMGRGGELYMLDMGDPVNITEMAETLIRLHGREPYSDVQIVFTGIRPGEKLFEEMFYDPDHVDRTGHDKIFLSGIDERGGLTIDEVLAILLDEGLDEKTVRDGIFSLAAE